MHAHMLVPNALAHTWAHTHKHTYTNTHTTPNIIAGRVPAGLCGCVGIKGTLGSVSTVGVVPACASLDCLTVFARSVQDAAELMHVMRSASAALDVWRRMPMQVSAIHTMHTMILPSLLSVCLSTMMMGAHAGECHAGWGWLSN
jgi:hypothetical protein